MDLSDIRESLEHIQENPPDDDLSSFAMSEMEKEIDNIIFEDKCKRKMETNFREWVIAHPKHSYPKTRRKWLNALQSHHHISRLSFTEDPKDVINVIRYNLKIPTHARKMYQNVIRYLKTKHITDENQYDYITVIRHMCVIHHRLLGEFILQHLLECHLLIRDPMPHGRIRPAYWLITPSRTKRPLALPPASDDMEEYRQKK